MYISDLIYISPILYASFFALKNPKKHTKNTIAHLHRVATLAMVVMAADTLTFHAAPFIALAKCAIPVALYSETFAQFCWQMVVQGVAIVRRKVGGSPAVQQAVASAARSVATTTQTMLANQPWFTLVQATLLSNMKSIGANEVDVENEEGEEEEEEEDDDDVVVVVTEKVEEVTVQPVVMSTPTAVSTPTPRVPQPLDRLPLRPRTSPLQARTSPAGKAAARSPDVLAPAAVRRRPLRRASAKLGLATRATMEQVENMQ
jgi:hypothetical protein